MKRLSMLTSASILLLVVLTLSTGAFAADPNQQGELRTVELVAKEFTFEPSTVQVEPGSRVRIKLVNKGNLSHNLQIKGNGGKTETLQTGNSDTMVVKAPESGELAFFCNVTGHKQAGMKGEITVQE